MTTTKSNQPSQLPSQLGMIGLGRMGANMVRRLMRAGHTCVVYDVNPEAVAALVAEGAIGATSLTDLASKLTAPRAAWVMVPLQFTESTVNGLADALSPGDCIIDGGNSFFKDDLRRAAAFAPRGLDYVDVGTSGGVWGLERGYCLMVGGAPAVVNRLMPIFETLAPGIGDIPRTPGRTGEPISAEQGFLHCGTVGSGHFVKMVHNGIEYGLMQAYAEGFDIMRHAADETLPAEQRLCIDLPGVAELWRRGSVVSSWLLDLTAQALVEDPSLSNYSGFVQDSGEGRWTINAAIEEAVPADVLSAALFARFRSRQEHTFADKMLSAMRHKFGGHTEPPKGGKAG
jgi:6-phosphogluconate dehydrogenase